MRDAVEIDNALGTQVHPLLTGFQAIEETMRKMFGWRRNIGIIPLLVHKDFLYSVKGDIIGSAAVYLVNEDFETGTKRFAVLSRKNEETGDRFILDFVEAQSNFLWINYFAALTKFEDIDLQIAEGFSAILYPNGILHIKRRRQTAENRCMD